MFSTLTHHLGEHEDTLGSSVRGKVVLILERSFQVDGTFLLSHFLSLSLLPAHQFHDTPPLQRPIRFIGIRNTQAHYATMMKKAGVDILGAIEKGDLHFVDILTGLGEYNTLEKKSFPFCPVDDAERSREMIPAGEETLFIDDLNEFVGHKTDQCVTWMHFIRSSCHDATLFVVAHSDGAEEDDKIANYVESIADVVLIVEPLRTGFSKDVHGHLKILRKDTAGFAIDSSILHFNRGLTSVKFFAPGTLS